GLRIGRELIVVPGSYVDLVPLGVDRWSALPDRPARIGIVRHRIRLPLEFQCIGIERHHAPTEGTNAVDATLWVRLRETRYPGDKHAVMHGHRASQDGEIQKIDWLRVAGRE